MVHATGKQLHRQNKQKPPTSILLVWEGEFVELSHLHGVS
jgi:hypothetical protein